MITPVNCQSPVTGSHPISPPPSLASPFFAGARSIIRSSSHLKAHNLPARPPRSAYRLLDLPTGVIAARIPLLPAMVVEDDEPFQTPSPSTSPSLSQSPPPPPISVVDPSATPPLITHPSNSVTVAAAAPLHQTLTLALPIQPPPGSAAFGGNGREDCWSEGATSALIDAWGERFVELSRGSLKQKHWQEVADVVSSRDDYSKTPRTDAQCKNRIDTLKKKYKLEKAKIAGPGSSAASCWPFFNRLDALLGNIVKPSPSAPKHPSPASVATVARSQFPQKQRTSLPFKRKAYTSLQAASASSTSDSFPPEAIPPPATNGRRGLPAARTRELTRAILKFGEVYQRVESSKLQQAIEMERQRMGFRRELEMQRMQFFMKTQMELSQLKHRPSSARAGDGHGGGGSSSNQHHSRHHYHQTPRHNNNGIENSG